MAKRPEPVKDESLDFMLEEILENSAMPQRRILLWSILAFMVCLGAWMTLGKVDVVVTAPGIAVPAGQTKIVQAVEAGSVSRILAMEGAHVKAGDVMLEIDPSMSETDMASKEKNLASLRMEMDRIEALLGRRKFRPQEKGPGRELAETQRKLFRSIDVGLRDAFRAKELEIRKTQEAIEDALSEAGKTRLLIAADRERKARLEKVLDIMPVDEFDRASRELLEHEQQLRTSLAKAKTLRFQKRQLAIELAAIREKSDADMLRELSELQKQFTALNAEVGFATFRNSKQRIQAPASGYVSKAMIHTVGAVVVAAQPLFEIVPDSMPLVIKATVLNKDVGQLAVGKEVIVKVDAFDYQKFGKLSGTITEISKNSQKDERLGQVYEITVSLGEARFKRGDPSLRLAPGMTVIAETKVSRRRIIEFFLYPLFRHFNEGMSVT